LQRRFIYKKLAWLNELPADEAEYIFRECGGSDEWAREMTARRPFPMLEQLFAAAAETSDSLNGNGSLPFRELERRLGKLLER